MAHTHWPMAARAKNGKTYAYRRADQTTVRENDNTRLTLILHFNIRHYIVLSVFVLQLFIKLSGNEKKLVYIVIW